MRHRSTDSDGMSRDRPTRSQTIQVGGPARPGPGQPLENLIIISGPFLQQYHGRIRRVMSRSIRSARLPVTRSASLRPGASPAPQWPTVALGPVNVTQAPTAGLPGQ